MARCRVMNGTITNVREHAHMSEVVAWFSELRFASSRRTTVRLSRENAAYAETVAKMCEAVFCTTPGNVTNAIILQYKKITQKNLPTAVVSD